MAREISLQRQGYPNIGAGYDYDPAPMVDGYDQLNVNEAPLSPSGPGNYWVAQAEYDRNWDEWDNKCTCCGTKWPRPQCCNCCCFGILLLFLILITGAAGAMLYIFFPGPVTLTNTYVEFIGDTWRTPYGKDEAEGPVAGKGKLSFAVMGTASHAATLENVNLQLYLYNQTDHWHYSSQVFNSTGGTISLPASEDADKISELTMDMRMTADQFNNVVMAMTNGTLKALPLRLLARGNYNNGFFNLPVSLDCMGDVAVDSCYFPKKNKLFFNGTMGDVGKWECRLFVLDLASSFIK